MQRPNDQGSQEILIFQMCKKSKSHLLKESHYFFHRVGWSFCYIYLVGDMPWHLCRGQKTNCRTWSLLLPEGFWESNSGHLACWQSPLRHWCSMLLGGLWVLVEWRWWVHVWSPQYQEHLWGNDESKLKALGPSHGGSGPNTRVQKLVVSFDFWYPRIRRCDASQIPSS